MVGELILAAAVSSVAVVAAISAVKLISIWRSEKMPKNVQAEMSETDIEKIVRTQQIINEFFGGNFVECIKNTDEAKKLSLMYELAVRLADEYGLEVDIDIISDNSEKGRYLWSKKKLEFNIIPLMISGDHPQYDIIVKETLDAMIHELRHAVQHRAIEEDGFWNVSDERRIAWADNRINYISSELDIRAYALQPLEKDAYTFAAMIMEGV